MENICCVCLDETQKVTNCNHFCVDHVIQICMEKNVQCVDKVLQNLHIKKLRK